MQGCVSSFERYGRFGFDTEHYTFGPAIIKEVLKNIDAVFFDSHLMITDQITFILL